MASQGRYDFMKEGVVSDEISKSNYPDPLSLNYLNLTLSENPFSDKMTDSKIIYFWKEVKDIYGTPHYDDMILTLNGISHKNFLKQGTTIYFPILSDLTNSFNKKR